MAQPKAPEPVTLICGILAGREAWLDEAVALLGADLGEIDLVSDTVPFDFTDYYAREMGPHLLRRFVGFEALRDPYDLADLKRLTNELERHITGDVARPINLDPGTVNGSQLVLASTKPYAHRIYLRDGIYAEVTLIYQHGRWVALPWTYPDYAGERYHPFLSEVRQRHLARRRVAGCRETTAP